MSNLQKDFIDSNDLFINRLAKLSQEEVKLPKNRDKFLEISIYLNLTVDLVSSLFFSPPHRHKTIQISFNILTSFLSSLFKDIFVFSFSKRVRQQNSCQKTFFTKIFLPLFGL